MIIKNRGIISKRQVSRRPKSSIPQKESSVHLNLQVLFSKKSMLESNALIWESKISAIYHELEKVKAEINELESYAKNVLNSDLEDIKSSVSSNSFDVSIKNNVKIVDLEY